MSTKDIQYLIIIVVFICMLMVSTRNAEQYKAERDEARHELIVTVPRLEARMQKLKDDADNREVDLLLEYSKMLSQYKVLQPPAAILMETNQ